MNRPTNCAAAVRDAGGECGKPVTALPILARALAVVGYLLGLQSFPGYGVLWSVCCMYNARLVDGPDDAGGNNIQDVRRSS